MYLRWQKRERECYWGWGRPGDITWTAILVESHRIDGKPRQKHVAYLGSFSESQVTPDMTFQQVYVWEHMIERLDALGNRLTGEDRARVEAGLSEKIGRKPPTKEEIEQTHRRAEEGLGELASAINQARRK